MMRAFNTDTRNRPYDPKTISVSLLVNECLVLL